MADRIDHLQRIREEGEPTVSPEKDAPLVTPDLVAYLERAFASPYPQGVKAGSQDDQVKLVADMAAWGGACMVINHLKTLIRTA